MIIIKWGGVEALLQETIRWWAISKIPLRTGLPQKCHKIPFYGQVFLHILNITIGTVDGAPC